jgi:hypothetical protein
MSKCPWPHSAVSSTFGSPDSVQRLASSMTAASACEGSGAGMIPSDLANVTAAAKHSRCGLATASNSPSSYACESSGDMPWYRSPPACTGSGIKSCPSVCIFSSGVNPAVSPKSYA